MLQRTYGFWQNHLQGMSLQQPKQLEYCKQDAWLGLRLEVKENGSINQIGRRAGMEWGRGSNSPLGTHLAVKLLSTWTRCGAEPFPHVWTTVHI
jgi:hypothetical protein